MLKALRQDREIRIALTIAAAVRTDDDRGRREGKAGR